MALLGSAGANNSGQEGLNWTGKVWVLGHLLKSNKTEYPYIPQLMANTILIPRIRNTKAGIQFFGVQKEQRFREKPCHYIY